MSLNCEIKQSNLRCTQQAERLEFRAIDGGVGNVKGRRIEELKRSNLMETFRVGSDRVFGEKQRGQRNKGVEKQRGQAS